MRRAVHARSAAEIGRRFHLLGDDRDAFDFYPAKYDAQLVAGYSKNTPAKGLKTYMPDYNDLARATDLRTPSACGRFRSRVRLRAGKGTFHSCGSAGSSRKVFKANCPGSVR